jgi:hypothetical protein
MSLIEEKGGVGMKRIVALVSLAICTGLFFGDDASLSQSPSGAQGSKTPPDVIQLATASKLGKVTFSHTDHTTKNHNIEGTGPIACIECHHVEQPASEVAKHSPLKTAWPANRTVTLTAESLKDQGTPPVTGCRNCHARTGEKPAVLPEIPEMKSENSTAMIRLTNQQAFHRMCAGCHDQAIKTRQDVKAPASTKCTGCHKK